MNLFVRIATCPPVDPALCKQIAEDAKHPVRMTVRATIAKWEKEEKAQAILDAISDAATDGRYGRVALIVWAFNDGDVAHVAAGSGGGVVEKECPTPLQDKAVLRSFAETVEGRRRLHSGFYRMICHSPFAARFLHQRFTMVGIQEPSEWPHGVSPFDSTKRFDVNIQWACSVHMQDQVDLKDLARAMLGVERKPKLTGDDVLRAFTENKATDVINYLRDDVERLRGIYKKLTFAPAAKMTEAA